MSHPNPFTPCCQTLGHAKHSKGRNTSASFCLFLCAGCVHGVCVRGVCVQVQGVCVRDVCARCVCVCVRVCACAACVCAGVYCVRLCVCAGYVCECFVIVM